MRAREDGAHRQASQVQGERQLGGLVQIVDTPDKPPVRVAPGSEVLDVQIAHGKNRQPAGHAFGGLRPNLGPAVIGSPKEGENRLGHQLVFLVQVAIQDHDLLAQPRLVTLCGVDDVHRLSANTKGRPWQG